MRYYIEISEQEAAQLKQWGQGDRVLMIDSAPTRHRPLLKAIEEVTGVTPARIFSNERTRYVVIARTIYTHYARINGDGIEQIARDLHRRRWAVNFYLRDFETKLAYDMEFKSAEFRVCSIISDDPEWRPPKRQSPNVGQISRRKKKRRKRRRRPQPVLQNNIQNKQEQIAERRQLKIQF